MLLQRIEVFLYRLRRILQTDSMVLRCFDDEAGCEIEEMKNEFIRMLGLDVEEANASAGKSAKLHVTIKLAPHRIADANTCRSSSSGRTSPGIKCS
jgi:hypothetical protein